jgi:hypoxanthine phosphoribosyltransferase
MMNEHSRGVQWLSLDGLQKDVMQWSRGLSDFGTILAVSRSGMTAGHLLSAELGCACRTLGGWDAFRQDGARQLVSSKNAIIIDDCVSTGGAMRQIARKYPKIERGAVYVRLHARSAVDRWYKLHAEPDWLVVSQWNFLDHQDTCRIVFDSKVLFHGGAFPLRLRRKPCGIRATGFIPDACKLGADAFECRIDDICDVFPSAALYVTDSDDTAIEASRILPSLSVKSWKCYGSRWPSKVIGIGLPRTGSASLCSALIHAGYRTRHSPQHVSEIDIADAVADAVIGVTVDDIMRKYQDAYFVLTVRNPQEWAASMLSPVMSEFWRLTETPGTRQNRQYGRLLLPAKHSREALCDAYNFYRHEISETAKRLKTRLVEHDAKDGWAICDKLGIARPPCGYPHKNNRSALDVGIANC